MLREGAWEGSGWLRFSRIPLENLFAHPLFQAALLAAAPPAVFFGLRVRAMAASTFVDPAFYQAYAENGLELMKRFGPDFYFWSRVGLTIPARLFWRAFGTLPGFYAFRYVLALLAIVPAYLLFRRLHGLGAGWIAVLVVLTCPVILTAWGSDYPDSAAVSYLIAGIACLVMPSSARGRRGWLLAAGGLMALAVCSQPVEVLVVASALAAYLAIHWRRPAATATDLLLVTAAALVATGGMIALSARIFGVGDFFSPNIAAAGKLSSIFHSTTWKWLLYYIYLLVPPAAGLAWFAGSWRARTGPSRAEATLALTTLLAVASFAFYQFIERGWTLETYYYSSVLFAGGSLTVAALLVRASQPLLSVPHGRRGWLMVAPAVIVIAVPVLLRPFRALIQMELPTALVLVLIMLAIGVLSRRQSASHLRPAAMTTALVICVTTLLTGLPVNRPIFPGQAGNITPDYGSVLFSDGTQDIEDYVVASQLKAVIPSVWTEPGDVITWRPAGASNAVNLTAAQLLWNIGSIASTLPDLDADQAHYLAVKRPRWLIMLSSTGRDFDAGEAQLARHGFEAQTWKEGELRSGGTSVWVRVLELKAFPTLTDPPA